MSTLQRSVEKYSAPKNAHNLILQENQDEDDYDYYRQFDSGLHMARNWEVNPDYSKDRYIASTTRDDEVMTSKELYQKSKKTAGSCQKMQQTIGYAPGNNLKTPKSFSTLNYDGIL